MAVDRQSFIMKQKKNLELLQRMVPIGLPDNLSTKITRNQGFQLQHNRPRYKVTR